VISDGAKEIISRLLDPNPETRMTIPEIMTHPWFLKNLPEGALEMNELYLPKPDADAANDAKVWPGISASGAFWDM
jgi:serine/threonine protein kinase